MERHIDWSHPAHGHWTLTCTWGAVEGRLACTGVALAPRGMARAVTTSVWRAIPLARLIESARPSLDDLPAGLSDELRPPRPAVPVVAEVPAGPPTPSLTGMADEEAPDWARLLPRSARGGTLDADGSSKLTRPGRPPKTTGHYRQVADAYAEALCAGSRTPTRDVATRFGVARPTAGKWVRTARRMGLLAATTRGAAAA